MVHTGNGIFILTRNKLLNYEKTWKELKCILLIERSHFVKAIYHMISTTLQYGKDKTVEIIKRSAVTGALGKERKIKNRWTPRDFRAVKFFTVL